jgi:hypothetical protein
MYMLVAGVKGKTPQAAKPGGLRSVSFPRIVEDILFARPKAFPEIMDELLTPYRCEYYADE